MTSFDQGVCLVHQERVFFVKAQVSSFRSHFDREGQGPDH